MDDTTNNLDFSIASSGDNAYLIEAVEAENESDAIIADQHDTYQIVIPLGVAQNITATSGNKAGYKTDPTNPLNEFAIVSPTIAPFPNDETVLQNTTYTLRDVRADSIGNADTVQFDNSDIYILPAGEDIELRISTASGAIRYNEFTTAKSLNGKEEGTVIL